MFKVESLKDYMYIEFQEEYINLVTKIYQLTKFVNEYYPNYKEWLFHKQLLRTITDEGNILFVRNPHDEKEIIAMTALKKTENEQKICTLYVKENFQNHGIGSLLIEKSLEWLETKYPLITIPQDKFEIFLPIINKYNWQISSIEKYSNDTIQEVICNQKPLEKIKIKYNKNI